MAPAMVSEASKVAILEAAKHCDLYFTIDGVRKQYPLIGRNRYLMVGRGDNVDVHIDNDRSVSDQHLLLRMVDTDEMLICDLGSSNGTFIMSGDPGVPPIKVIAMVVRPGTTFRIGRTDVRFDRAQDRSA